MFIHAGYNKTATTFLQQRVFTPIFGKELAGSMIKINALQTKMFDIDQPLLISDESLLGVTIFKRHNCRNTQRYNFLANWARICPNTQFIICIRNHKDFLESLYCQYLHVGGDLNPSSFLELHNDSGFIKKNELLYEPILAKVYEFFPNLPHFIYDFELFREKPEFVIEKMLNFMDVKITSEQVMELLNEGNSRKKNVSVNYYSGSCLRFFNKFISSTLNKKIIPLHIFSIFTFGRSPREIFQKLSFLKTKKRFTSELYLSLKNEFDKDWCTVKIHNSYG